MSRAAGRARPPATLTDAPLEAPSPRRRREHFLSFSPPTVGGDEIAEVVDCLQSDWISTGPKTARFEREFAHTVGAAGALALNSCTAGLHVALVARGIGPGHEVITTPLTFAATVNVIEHVGARPVLCDVEPDTLNIDPTGIAAALTSRTRAIIPVHFGGHPADMPAIDALAEPRGLFVLEDAAHALPAWHGERMIGSGTHAAAFSFYATKNLTTAEGGMLTGEPELLERCRVLSLHGMSRNAAARYAANGHWHYDVLAPGFKYNMSDVQASIGLAQLRRLDAMQRRRRAIVAAYEAAFAGEEALELPVVRAGVVSAWHLYVIRLRPAVLRLDRDRFIEELRARNIGASVHFIPIHLHTYYRERYGFAPEQYPVALDAFRRSVSLPLTPRLSDADVTDVIEAVRDILARFRR